MLNSPTLWGLAGGLVAVFTEYLYRTLEGPWLRHAWVWVPMQVVVGYCIYRIVTLPNVSLIDAFIVWTLSTAIMRVFVSLVILGDVVGAGTWVALVLLLLARAAQALLGR